MAQIRATRIEMRVMAGLLGSLPSCSRLHREIGLGYPAVDQDSEHAQIEHETVLKELLDVGRRLNAAHHPPSRELDFNRLVKSSVIIRMYVEVERHGQVGRRIHVDIQLAESL